MSFILKGLVIAFVSWVQECAPHTRAIFNHILLSSSESKMCPLRFILVFLSATLAGFFVLRNLRSQPPTTEDDGETVAVPSNPKISDSSDASSNATSKVHPLPPFASISQKLCLFNVTLNLCGSRFALW
ncbi:hypothetical protein LR48_Vigan09g135000 [Vigna angularis]|uniref:Uncharacterized protein n=1 Tax=Phaseolus angularis TaxID=3914 RepID=A0A0L9VC99_PHAAN|nr:hypothetical protein LR48_Vigan09g135000 [Vigna angularis]